jgi:uncharacterized protein YgiM (DUF1202 family)
MSKKRDYTRFSHAPAEAVEAVEVMEVAEEIVEQVVEPKVGIVTDCTRLNVRQEPKANAKIVIVVDATTDLTIFEEKSTEDFYKIRTVDGVEGYCMKRFVTINP